MPGTSPPVPDEMDEDQQSSTPPPPLLASGRSSDAPKMDRPCPDVALPPFEPLDPNELFIDIVPASSTSSSRQHSTRGGGDDDDDHEQNNKQQNNDDSANNNNHLNSHLISSELWPYQPTNGVRELLDRTSVVARRHEHRFPDAERLREHFRDGGLLSVDDALWIINLAASVLGDEPNVLEVKSPVTVCGDIHGQYYDLMTLFDLGGNPIPNSNNNNTTSGASATNGTQQQQSTSSASASPNNNNNNSGTQYLFLGDYVDRGCYSTEVALLLLSYKIMNPTNFWMIRGNHECRHLTAYFNFKTECIKKYNEVVYDTFMNCFDALPLACRIDGKFLCVHGGIGPDIKSVEDISLIQRQCEPPPRGPMCDLLWADPMEPDEESAAPGARFLYNDIRSCSYSFSYKATLEFLKANNLLSVIRAHESQFEGYRMFQKVPETGMPSVICIFSAPNYCEYNNKASIMLLEDHTMRIRQFGAVEHPYMLQNFLNAFSWSMPFLTEKMQHVCSEFSGFSTELLIPITAGSQNANNSNNNGATSGDNDNNKKTSSSSSSAAVATTKADGSRPLHALLAKPEDALVAAAAAHSRVAHHHYKLRSMYLLSPLLRRRGRIILIKVKFCVWLLRFRQRQEERGEQKQRRDGSVSSTQASVAATAPSTTVPPAGGVAIPEANKAKKAANRSVDPNAGLAA